MYLIYNHSSRTGRIVDQNYRLIRELPAHRSDNPPPRFTAVAPFHYTEQFRSYLSSLYMDEVLEESPSLSGSVWALIQVCDEDDMCCRDEYQTYGGKVGFLIKEGEIFSEICIDVIEEII